jgi:hypothetical protein
MSFKNITPAWQPTLGRVIHSAALRARARAPRAAIRQPRYLCETAESADTAAIIFELAIQATSDRMLPPHTAQRSSRPAAEHVEQSVVDAWWQEGGAEGGPNGTKGGGGAFQIVALLQKSEVREYIYNFGLFAIVQKQPCRVHSRKIFFCVCALDFVLLRLVFVYLTLYCLFDRYGSVFPAGLTQLNLVSFHDFRLCFVVFS